MTTIKEIIKKIDDLESEFNLFNSRILEFAKSTNNSNIDAELLNKYIKNLKEYKNLWQQYKKEVEKNISNKDFEEYKWQKSIVSFRLEKLNKIFDNSIRKLDIINSTISYKNEKTNDIEVDFHSTNEMIEINKNLYDFYNNYNKNLEYQKTYNIWIKLDDNFEKKQEKNLKSFSLVIKENKYIEELNQLFEELEELNNKFYDEFKRLTKYENIIFLDLDKLYNFYFPENWIHFIFRIFRDKLSDSYINHHFNVKKSEIFSDFKKFKTIINRELKYIDFLIRFNDFANNYNNFIKLDNKYKLFTNFNLFNNLMNIFNKINNKNFWNVDEIINYINKNFYNKDNKTSWFKIIFKSIEIFEKSYKFIKEYDNLFKSKSGDLDRWFFNNLFSFATSSELIWKSYILEGLENIKNKLKSDLDIWDYRTNIDLYTKLSLINKSLKNHIIRLKNIEKTIKNINKIVDSVTYSVWYSALRYKNSTFKNLKLLNTYLLFSSSSIAMNPLKNFINSIITSKYSSAKRAYQNRQTSSSSYSGSSSYSSSSSSSSSSRSSGSSSFSSSYSSSWGSSW